MSRTTWLIVAVALAMAGRVWGADDVGIKGTLMLIGGTHQDLADDLRAEFFKLAGGKEAKIVVIPTAIKAAEEPEVADELLTMWAELKPRTVVMLHTRDRAVANDPAFVKPITEATAVFFSNGHRDRVFNAYRGTLVEAELKKLQARGGLIGGTGTGAAVLGESAINRASDGQEIEPGLGLLAGCLIEDRGDHEQFQESIASAPVLAGLALDGKAALVIRGKTIRVLGAGVFTVRLGKGGGKEEKVEQHKAGVEIDLVELRKDAASRGKK
jgi:cyanophycinase